jgi:hypothetical protein
LSTYDDRVDVLRQQVADAAGALDAVSQDQREPYKEHVERLEHVLAYAALVIERTDAELVSDAALNELSAPLTAITADPGATPPNAAGWGNQLLDAAARFPASRDRELEQRLRKVVANFKTSAQQRLVGLDNQVTEAQSRIQALDADIDGKTQGVTETLDGISTNFQQRLDDLEVSAASFRESIDQVATQQTEAFNETQTSRDTEFRERLDAEQQEVSALIEASRTRVEEEIAEIQRIASDMGQLSGAYALAATAESFGKEAEAQQKIANTLRLTSLISAVLAVVLAFIVTLQHHPDNSTFAGKLAVSVLIGAIATYLAKQSGRHRRREERARSLQLELTAFSPFIEPLPEDRQVDERVLMTRRTFRGGSLDPEEDEQGPMPLDHALSQIGRRRKT